jgi:hypothetical protein
MGSEPIDPFLAPDAADGGRAVELTILMPCLNEAETIGRCIVKARAYLARSGVDGEVLVADNGSTDDSIAIAIEHGARVVHVPRRGYGAALIGGIEAARGRYVIMGDADDSYDFSRLDRFVEALRSGSGLVMGNRFRGGVEPGAMPPLHRYLGNPVLSFLGRLLFRTGVGDFHCGLRGFSREAARRLRLRSDGMEFASEMVLKAALLGVPTAEVPVTLSPDGRSRPPHLRSWRDGWRHLKLLFSFAPRWLFLYPGLALFGPGLALVALLMAGPLTVGGIRLDVASLVLGLAATLTGAQLIAFWAFAQLEAVQSGLLPETERFGRLRAAVSIDRASLVGGLLVLVGIAAAGVAVFAWGRAGLGDLDPSRIARPAALSVLGLALGVQVVTGGFMWEILERRRGR